MDTPFDYENMLFIEQFVEDVVAYTSRYNNSMSVSYAPDNVIGKTVKYPEYGDYPDTYMLRSYGKWWNTSEGAQKEYMPQDVGPIVSEDFIIVKYEQPVMATGIKIYETYNPGAVVRIWGGNTNKSWHLLWEGPPEYHDRTPTQFTPPIRIIRELINYLRIDFNQSLLQYHTSIDGVLLAGYRARYCVKPSITPPRDIVLEKNLNKPKLRQVKETTTDEMSCSFSILPYELIVDIFRYLDLRSLCSCAQVNRIFHAASIDSTLYRNLCFKRYWNLITDHTLSCFIPKCNFLRKLDLSWCGYDDMITEAGFIYFLTSCGKHLTHLSLGNCSFIRQKALIHISHCTDLIDLRLRNCNPDNSDNFLHLGNLRNLQALDLYLSNIDDQSLVRILKNNIQLLHVNIDLCEQLTELDFITEVLATYNKSVRTFSCWKGQSLTAEGIKQIAKCSDLRELDVGWCLIINDPGDCLSHLAQGCPNLTKLVISCWRGLGDHQLCPLIRYCTKLKQLDLLGTRNITGDICERALEVFTQLELFDVSFCDGITRHQVRNWRQKYRHVTIQRSCESVVRGCFSN